MDQRNHYATLGVDFTASSKEIKKAYRKLALKWHPDKQKTSTKAKTDKSLIGSEFKCISESYEILSDPVKREAYDNALCNTESTEQSLNPYRNDFKAHSGNAAGQATHHRGKHSNDSAKSHRHREDMLRTAAKRKEALEAAERRRLREKERQAMKERERKEADTLIQLAKLRESAEKSIKKDKKQKKKNAKKSKKKKKKKRRRSSSSSSSTESDAEPAVRVPMMTEKRQRSPVRGSDSLGLFMQPTDPVDNVWNSRQTSHKKQKVEPQLWTL